MHIRKKWVAAVLLALGSANRTPAHSMDQAALLLDFRGGSVNVEVQLPAERLYSALGTEEISQVFAYIVSGLSAAVPDGRPFAVEPVAAPYLPRVEGTSYVSIRTDWRTSTFANQPQLLGVLREADRTIRVDRRRGSWWTGFGSVFQLGMRHIAERTDHLLFLLVLLLPAPLLVICGQWMGYTDVRQCLMQIGKVVTAFTAGHSVTLAAGALNLVHVPGRPVEVLVAASILVSAGHALRPLFPGREAVIAGSFGLIQGMAFATTLAGFGLSRWERVAAILGFNLGIEAMQLVVVAAALPSLILLSRTGLYGAIRIIGAGVAGVAAAAWIAQRLWDFPNPADAVVTALAQRAGWIAAGLTVLGIFVRTSGAIRRRPIL